VFDFLKKPIQILHNKPIAWDEYFKLYSQATLNDEMTVEKKLQALDDAGAMADYALVMFEERWVRRSRA